MLNQSFSQQQQKFQGVSKLVILDVDAFLTPEDIGTEAELVFVDGGENGLIPKEGDQPDIKTFEIGVHLPNGEKRKWTINKTSQRAISTAYGVDSEKWVGKKVVAFVTPQNVKGTMKNVIYARVPVLEPVL